MTPLPIRAVPRQRFDPHVAVILLVAFALRLLAWRTLPYRDFISDEAEYWAAAAWLAQGRGFSFFDGWIWTRPPVYVLFLAAHVRLFGVTALWAPRLTQAALSVALVYLVMRLARKLAPDGVERRVALLAGWAMALSYSFASFAYFLLSETVFLVLFVAALLALIRWHADRRARWLIIAGGLLGLCALTKAIVLTWLPFVALWVLIKGQRSKVEGHVNALHSRSGSWFSVLGSPLLLTIAVCAVVLPWSAYATRRWGQGDGLILVDTTGGYNFALGAQTGRFDRRDENLLHDTLCGDPVICDARQAKRQAAAYELGWQWITDDPAGFVQKTGRELLDMIQLQYSGAERLRAGHTLGAVPLPHLLGLLWDDTLYVVAVLLAPFGLLRRQCRAGKGLIVSWLLYNIVVGALIFAINRFRQPLLPFIFIYAAIAIVQLGAAWSQRSNRVAAWAIMLVLALVIAPSYVYWPSFVGRDGRSVWQETLLGINGARYTAACTEIERVLRAGNVARARQLHDAADARIRQNPLFARTGFPCLALINARLLEAEGRIDGPDGALAFLARSNPPDNPAQGAKILMLEGDLLRRLGRADAAFQRFVARPVEPVNDLEWAWSELQPPPTPRIDLGAGLDWGYIEGFYPREGRAEDTGNYRWAGPQARLRFVGAGTGQPQTLTLRINGYTTNAQPTRIFVQAGDQPLPPITLSNDPNAWQTITLDLPATPAGQDVIVQFRSPVFVPGPDTLAINMRSQGRQSLRLLGFRLDWAELKDQG